MAYYKKLEGENLYLSPVCSDDSDLFVKWMNDMDVTDYTGRTAFIITNEAERNWIENVTKNGEYVFEIIVNDGDKPIGNISLNDVSNIQRSAELGIMIGESESRNKGYGTEAIKLILDYAFNYLNLNSIFLKLVACNERAKACYEKAGFKECGRLRKASFVNGKYFDLILMDILADEFKESYILNKNVK